jgi:hypothetical protein
MPENSSVSRDVPAQADGGIIHSGGWSVCATTVRPKMDCCLGLSILWIGVSFLASMPFWDGWPDTFGAVQWLGLLLLVPHPVLLGASVYFFFTDPPKPETQPAAQPRPRHSQTVLNA